MLATLVLATLVASEDPACVQLKALIEKETAAYVQCQQGNNFAESQCSKNRDDMQANMISYGHFCVGDGVGKS